MQKHLLAFILWGSILACFGQKPAFRLTNTVGTVLDSPYDIVADRAGFQYLAHGYNLTKMDWRGRYGKTLKLRPPVGSDKGVLYAAGVDKVGNVYVLNHTYSHIQKFTASGEFVLQFGSNGIDRGQFQRPSGMAIDEAGNLYVADTYNNRLQKFTAQGEFLFEYSGTGAYALPRPVDVQRDSAGNIHVLNQDFTIVTLGPAGQFVKTRRLTIPNAALQGEAISLAIDHSGNYYLYSSQSTLISKFSNNGTYIWRFHNDNTLVGSSRASMYLDVAGSLYVAKSGQQGGSKAVMFNATGIIQDSWGDGNSFGPLAQDVGGNYYYSDRFVGLINKYSAGGQLVSKIDDYSSYGGQSLIALAVDLPGNIYALSNHHQFGVRINKHAPDGRLLTQFTTLGGNINYSPDYSTGLAVDAAGVMYVTDYNGGCIRRIGPQGQLLPPISAGGLGSGQLWQPQAVAVDARGFVYAVDNAGLRVQRFSPSGQLAGEFGQRASVKDSVSKSIVHLAVDGAGTMYVSSSLNDSLQIYDPNGRGKVMLPNMNGYLAVDRNSTRLLTGKRGLLHFYTSDNARQENLISGNVFEDRNGNCTRDATEPALPGIVVSALPGPYYGLSDAAGNYVISVDTGTYAVQQLAPMHELARTITPICSSPSTFSFASYGNTVSGPDFGNQVSIRPYLSVSIASNRRRRCFRNVTTVSYANTGFEAASQAKVVVQLPDYVAFISSNVPHTQDAKGNYVFDVGNLPPHQRGSIVIQDSVICGNSAIRGLTVCTKAWITPANTYPAPANWNYASMKVAGLPTANNQARFVLSNQGRGATTDSLAFRVFQDARLVLNHAYSLAAGDSLVFQIPATGPVVRVEADQPPGHPVTTLVSATVEVPGLRTSAAPSAAMQAQPPGSPESEVAEDCQPIVDSFDPNDKQVVPTGVTAEHYTPTNTTLQYQIRFQNTGTDVAYQVTVVDTLSANLDISTLHVGAVSHSYRLAITGKQRPVLTFTFDGINLPDSAQNQAASQGFAQFSIRPKPALAAKALVANYADIYFDFNEPVRTNTTINRLYDMPLVVDPAVQLTYPEVVVSPAIREFTPTQGRAGTLVTIRGTGFAADPALNQVTLNGVSAPVTSATATSLTIRIPAEAVTGRIQVVTPNGGARSQSDFLVFLPPTITTVLPYEGVPGTIVTITGTGFSADSRQDTVAFNGVTAIIHRASATELTVEVPAGATLGHLTVHALGGGGKSAQPFQVWYPPTITGFTPEKGKVGTILTVTGTNFAASAARNKVTLGSSQAEVVQASVTQLRVRVPEAQSGSLEVRTPGGQVVAVPGFILVPAPVITDFSPQEGSVGTVVTIVGNHFNAFNQLDTIYVNGVAAPVLSADSTQAVVRVPKGAGTGPISVAGAGGTGRSSMNFVVVALTPDQALAVYPNPTHGQMTIDWQRADFPVQEISVYNAVGKLVSQQKVSHVDNAAVTLAMIEKKPGLYLVVIRTARGLVTKRIVVL